MSSHAFHILAAFGPALQAPAELGGAAGPDLTRYFLVCGALVVATALSAVAVKKLVAGNARLRAARRSLQIVDVLPVGGKQRVMVVRCYDRSFVLGVGAGEITPIAELDTQADLAAPAAPEKGAAAVRDSRKEAFLRALEQVRASMPGKEVRAKALPLERATSAPAAPAAAPRPVAAAQAGEPARSAKPARRRRRGSTAATPSAPVAQLPPPAAAAAPRPRFEGVLG